MKVEPRRHRRGSTIGARIAFVAAIAIAGAVLAGCGGVVRAGAPAAAPESPPAVTPERPEVVPPAGRGGADLLIAEIMVSDRNPAAGGAFVLSVIVGNDGTAAAPATRVRFLRSADEAITTDDSEVGAVELPPISAAGRAGGSVRLSAPASGGTFHYGACVEAVSGESETGNNCSAAVTVTVRAPPPGNPDLRIGSTKVGPVSRTVYVNDSIDMCAAVQNAGGGVSSGTTLRLYVSTSQTVAASDRTEAVTVAVPQIVASREFGAFKRLDAPGTGGTWYYRACVDAVATESDTTNNCGEVVELEVHANAPDFHVAARTASGTASPGDSFSLEVLVGNFGSIPSDTTTLRLYRSVDDTISSADSELDTVAIAQLATGLLASRRHSFQVTAPDTAGTYYYGACVDAAPNEVTTTDNCSSAVSVTVQ